MDFIPYIIGLLTFGCVFILANQYLYSQEQKRIRERVAPSHRKAEKKTVWFKELFTPLARINTRVGSRPFRAAIARNLLSAGNPVSVNEYLVFKELMMIFVPLIAAVILGWEKLLAMPLLIPLTAWIGFTIPNLWLRGRIDTRRKQVLHTLPNVIDLLILAVDAGLDFMIAVRRVVERSAPGPIVDELSYLYRQVHMGRVRRDALKTMAKRLNLTEVNSFVRTLVQAERMGTPMGDALRALSEEIRMRQFQRGEQQALKAPIKMLFPLLFCILPVVLILVGGPVILQFMQSGVNFFQ
jgi:tight adherence protein C